MPADDTPSTGVDPAPPPDASGVPNSQPGWRATLTNCTVILGLALLAGAASWLWGEVVFDHFKPSEKASAEHYAFAALNREMGRVNGLNGALAFGALGGLLGMALGLAGGLSRSAPKSALVGAIVGLVLGAASGTLPSFAIMPWHWKHRGDDEYRGQLVLPTLVHLGLWCSLGLTAGLAFGLGRYGPRPARLFVTGSAGLIGAIIGTCLFELAGAFLFPLAETVNPFSATSQTRLLARLSVALFVGLLVMFSFRPGDADERRVSA